MVFKSLFFYNNFLFNVFNIIDIKNKVNAKYKIKNIKTTSMLFFFAITNQKITKIISNSNLVPNEKKVYKELFCGDFDSPLVKITIQTIIIVVKTNERVKRSDKYFSTPSNNKAMAPMLVTPQPNAAAINVFLKDEIIALFF